MSHREKGCLYGLLGLALFFRLWGIEQGYPAMYGHVDEVGVAASIWNFFRAETLLPTEFTYPAFFSYLTAAALYLSVLLGWGPHIGSTFDSLVLISYLDPARAALVGRLLSAVLGTATVYMTFLLGRRVGGAKVGLAAALLLAWARVPVQQAHQALPDTTMAFVATCLFYAAWRIVEDASWRAYIGAGLAAGCVVATKYNGAFSALAIPAAHMLHANWRGSALWSWKLPAAVAVSFIALFACSPYLLLAADAYWGIAQYQVSSLDFSLRESQPWWWIVRSLIAVEWGVGCWFVAALLWGLWRRDKFEVLVLAAFVPSFVYIGSWTRESLHYLLHFYPVFAILAVRFGQAISSELGLSRRWIAVVMGAIVLPNVYAVSAANVNMTRPDVRLQAAQWIEAHVENGTRLATTWLPYAPRLELVSMRNQLIQSYARQPKVLEALQEQWRGKPAYDWVNLEIWLKEPVVPEVYRPHVDLTDQETRRVFSRGWFSPRQLKERGVSYIVLPDAVYGRYMEGSPPQGELSAAHYHFVKNRAYFSGLIDPESGLTELVARFKVQEGERGSGVSIYRLQ